MTTRQIDSALVNSLIQGSMKKELRVILDCIQDGIFITDGNGKILALNQASLDLCPYKEEELVGKTMQELLDKGMFEDAVSLEAIAQRHTVSEIQKGITGQYDLLVTATPYFDENEIVLVVVTERDITDLTNLKDDLNRLSERYEQEVEYYKAQTTTFSEIICKSSSMKELLRVAHRIAVTDATVMIQGESGTGKSLIAKFIFKNSSRSKNPFIEINCGAIPENLLESELFGYEKGAFTGASEKGKAGLFELANGGTLFLDEISSMPLHLQVKILRAIQEKEIMRVGGSSYIPIDIRIISATNTNLADAVKKGAFRKDLYYRLNVCQLEIPPLRSRKEDIQPLCEHFLGVFNKKYNTDKTFSSSAWKILYSYQWPGNIRELENMLERIIVTSVKDFITANQISALFPLENLEFLTHDNNSAIDLKSEVDNFEKNLILAKVKHFHSVSDLAVALSVDKSTVTRKLRRYDIKM
jgi:PAS domain S-box-containing protein